MFTRFMLYLVVVLGVVCCTTRTRECFSFFLAGGSEVLRQAFAESDVSTAYCPGDCYLRAVERSRDLGQ